MLFTVKLLMNIGNKKIILYPFQYLEDGIAKLTLPLNCIKGIFCADPLFPPSLAFHILTMPL